jgi:hypothetical protein
MSEYKKALQMHHERCVGAFNTIRAILSGLGETSGYDGVDPYLAHAANKLLMTDLNWGDGFIIELFDDMEPLEMTDE